MMCLSVVKAGFLSSLLIQIILPPFMTDAQGLSPTASKLKRGIVPFVLCQDLALCLAQLGAQSMILKE